MKNDKKEDILFQSVDKYDIINNEELEEIGVSYGSEKEYRSFLGGPQNFRRISSKGASRQYLVHNGGKRKANTTPVPWEKIKRIDVTGNKVTSPAEIAALLHHFRNPRIEIMNIIYTDDSGTVLAHSAFTSGLPSRSVDLEKYDYDNSIKLIQETAERLGASGVYVAHNHPSGNPEGSCALHRHHWQAFP